MLERPVRETSIVSPAGLFRIHYDLTGTHKPNYFEKKSTYTQIDLYSKLVGTNEILKNIQNLLRGDSNESFH